MPIRHFFQGSTNAIKRLAETEHRSERTHHWRHMEEPRRHGTRTASLPDDLLRYAPPQTPTPAKTTTGGTDMVGEDTGDMCMDVVEVSASEVCVLLGVVMMQVVDDEVVHAGEEETGDAPVAALDPVDSEDEEAEDEDWTTEHL
ncbi:hypothetical protein NDU88_001818 [Pleurodeles waltl]|uniref:Uncharacterized protein n=1 Tax=Pleurodeles waltl TaxID=8319 RepID=A0AAV7S8P8_PLEWA|nr:hypothetical protein NDU88_001818 [Pleurodeles waltl]